MGSNMAEQHPVGFQWVMEAKERGAKVIHVDPRFTRTSAMADLHVPIRPGTDIAFLGGIVNYIFRHEAYFEEYVRHYTNGPVILKDEFIDTDEVSGFFSGWDPDESAYAIDSWAYNKTSGQTTAGKTIQLADVSGDQAHGAHGMQLDRGEPPDLDNSMQDERCVLQVLRRHFARYTPENVADICGCAAADVERVAQALCENSGRERTSALVYSVGWTHAHRRRAERPGGRDRPAAARQRRASGRRRAGTARAREHPGLHRHPDALRHPARLHPDAASAGAPDARHIRSTQRAGHGGVGQPAPVHRIVAESVVGGGGD